MDFNLTPEQLLIKDSVARFATENGGAGKDADHWPQFAELGWLAIGAPEDLGGFGGALETLLVMEQFGRGLVIAPYLAQAVFAGALLRRAGRTDLLEPLTEGTRRFAVAYEETASRYDPRIVAATAKREGDGYRITGEKIRVLDGGTADTLIVSARAGDEISLFAVPADAAGVTRTPYQAEDEHDVATVRFENVRVADGDLVGAAGGGIAILDYALDSANAALTAEALGLAAAMLEMTVEYTKQRVQFGVPISSFQALQHRMAEMFMEVELIRSMAYRAAMLLDGAESDGERRRGVSAAKYQAAKSVRFVGQNAIQLHGGIGMSEEYKVGHYFKRSTLIERLLGDRGYHLARFQRETGAPARQPVNA